MTEDESYQLNLIIRLKRGDKAAFEEIYRLYSRRLYLKVFKMVKDKDVTDEIIQELFIKLWEHHQSINEEKSFQSYLYVIAQNQVYDYFRKLASDNKLMQSLMTGIYSQHLQVSNVDVLVENKEIAGLIKIAIDQLSPQRKMAFTLCKIEGRSYKEVSEIMGVSIATINSHITQSMQHIRAYMLKHRNIHILAITAYTTLYQVIRNYA